MGRTRLSTPNPSHDHRITLNTTGTPQVSSLSKKSGNTHL